MMDAELERALRLLHRRGGWVHLGTIGPGGWPHVTPVMMGVRDGLCLFSITGKQKKRNIERDSRCCVALSRAEDFAQVIMWGTMALRHDTEAQSLWDWLIVDQFGQQGLEQRRRVLSLDGTSLGVFTPQRRRLFAIPYA